MARIALVCLVLIFVHNPLLHFPFTSDEDRSSSVETPLRCFFLKTKKFVSTFFKPVPNHFDILILTLLIDYCTSGGWHGSAGGLRLRHH